MTQNRYAYYVQRVKSKLKKCRRKLDTIESDLADLKKKQLEIPKLKYAVQIKNLMDGLNDRLNIVELPWRASELEDRLKGNPERKKKNNIHKTKEAQGIK